MIARIAARKLLYRGDAEAQRPVRQDSGSRPYAKQGRAMPDPYGTTPARWTGNLRRFVR
jgi:hypothetical protein